MVVNEVTLGTGISPQYVKNWDVVTAMREVLQNALDTEKAYSANTSIISKSRTVIIADDGPGMKLKHLALGLSDKSAQDIGQFGEGLKLAMLVFAREGREFKLRSRDWELEPFIEDSQFETETLSFRVKYLDKHLNGTAVILQAFSSELEAAKEFFPEKFTKVRWLVEGHISKPGGKIIINGALAADLGEEAMFSYHLQGDRAKELLNRDRDLIDRYDAAKLIRDDLIQTLPSKDLEPWFRAIFKAISDEEKLPYLESLMVPMKYESKTKVLKIWKEVLGGEEVCLPREEASDKLAERLGYRLLSRVNADWFYSLGILGVNDSKDVVERKPLKSRLKRVPQKDLTGKERANLKKARDIVAGYIGDMGKVVIVENLGEAVPIPAHAGRSVDGLYDEENDIIYIGIEVLGDFGRALRVMAHETIHKITGASDLSINFQAKQDQIIGELLEEIVRRGD